MEVRFRSGATVPGRDRSRLVTPDASSMHADFRSTMRDDAKILFVYNRFRAILLLSLPSPTHKPKPSPGHGFACPTVQSYPILGVPDERGRRRGAGVSPQDVGMIGVRVTLPISVRSSGPDGPKSGAASSRSGFLLGIVRQHVRIIQYNAVKHEHFGRIKTYAVTGDSLLPCFLAKGASVVGAAFKWAWLVPAE